jgi:hypothetical protein
MRGRVTYLLTPAKKKHFAGGTIQSNSFTISNRLSWDNSRQNKLKPNGRFPRVEICPEPKGIGCFCQAHFPGVSWSRDEMFGVFRAIRGSPFCCLKNDPRIARNTRNTRNIRLRWSRKYPMLPIKSFARFKGLISWKIRRSQPDQPFHTRDGRW